jgi:Tfp pilus assembly protein PilO
VLLLISLLVLGVAGFAAKTLITNIIRDTKAVSAQSKANGQLDQDLQAAPQLVQAYQSLGANKNLIAAALPSGTDLPGFIALMENLSGSVGVNLKSVAPSLTAVAASGTATASASRDVSTPQPYNLTITLEGNYNALQGLLKAIEQSARPIRITAIQITGSANDLSIQLDATTYYQGQASLPFKKEVIK